MNEYDPVDRLNNRNIAVAITVWVLLLFSITARAQTKIPGVGYTPPPNAIVYHCDTSTSNLTDRCGGKTTPLNTSIPWSGSNGDVNGYVGRYLGGRVSCAASWICGVGNENECLNSSRILREMFQRGELGDRNLYTGEPTRTECHDFGAQHPELGSLNTGGTSGLRAQPTNPPGCCKSRLPCVVDDPRRRVGETWQEPVSTPQGGRVGCFMIRPASASGSGQDGDNDNGANNDDGTPPVNPPPVSPTLTACYRLAVFNDGSVTLATLNLKECKP